ncbi:uncharacterized protein BJ171DRAFT_565649 [Polychytrium aggregatum]|uniref:uncharacterized protein n=1 Tax=Polychytrium aggregatum TaxID=110093 RepID=UPI0022FE447A|nr:uncharacterized protein BJ171DRAFT_565649 [Polychytrium aggregatum]KAI9207902.1 hypothetical protein BJ171DRAFT_565649 [Polychytrium aggregatum]
MSFKDQLIAWDAATKAFDKGDYLTALKKYESIADTSKIHFNIATLYLIAKKVDMAIDALTRSVACDPYLAVSLFQRGTCFYNQGLFRDAVQDFTAAYSNMRGNQDIDYTQLGLGFKLYAAHILFNRGLAYVGLQQTDKGIADFNEALRNRSADRDFDILDEAVSLGADAHRVLSPFYVPANAIYRPDENKVKNSDKVDYLGSSKVVAASENSDGFVGFSGRQQAATLGRTPTARPIARTVTENVPPSRTVTLPRQASLARGATMRSDSVPPSGAISMPRPTRQMTTHPLAESSAQNGGIFRTQTSTSFSDAPKTGMLKVKCHFNEGIKIIQIAFDATYEEMVGKIKAKHEITGAIKLKYRDNDGEFVLMTDQDDLDTAMEVSGVYPDGQGSDRLEVWCALR